MKLCGFGSGGTSDVQGLVTAGGDEKVAPLHGMGAASVSFQSVAGGLSCACVCVRVRVCACMRRVCVCADVLLARACARACMHERASAWH